VEACEEKDTGRRVISVIGHTIPAYRNMNMRPAYSVAAYQQFVAGIVDSHGRTIKCIHCGGTHDDNLSCAPMKQEVPNAGDK